MNLNLDFEILTDFMFNLERGFCVYKNGQIQAKPWKPLCFYKSGIIYPKSGILICNNGDYMHEITSTLADKDQEFYENYPQDFLFRSTNQCSPVCFKKQLIPMKPVKAGGITEMGSRRIMQKSLRRRKQDRFTWSDFGHYKKQSFCSVLVFQYTMVIMNRDAFYEFHREIPVLTVGNVISRFVNLIELKNKNFGKIQKDVVNASNGRHGNYYNVVNILKLDFPDKSIEKCCKCKIPLLNNCAVSTKNNNYCFSCQTYCATVKILPKVDYSIICAGATIKGVLVSQDECDFITGVFEFINGYKKKDGIFTRKKIVHMECEHSSADMFSGCELADRLAIIDAVSFAKILVGIFQAPETQFIKTIKKKLSEKTFIM